MQRDRISSAAVALALVALVAWAAWHRWTQLTVTPFAVGVDGYYYPIQLRALLETGALHYPASPLTFWWMAPFAAATDPITGAKLGAAIGCALAVLPAYGVAHALTGQRGASLVASAIVASSATAVYVSMEFVKQGIGLTVALAALWLVLRACSAPTRPRIAAALVTVVATALTHKLAAGFVLVITALAALQEARARGIVRGRRLLYLAIISSVVGVVTVIAGIVAPERFLSSSDLRLVTRVLSTDAHWDAPAFVFSGVRLTFDHEALIAGVVSVIAATILALRLDRPAPTDEHAHRLRPGARVVAWSVVAFGLVIALPWLDVSEPQGLGFRLRVSAFVPLAVAGALVAATLANAATTKPSRRRYRDPLLATIAVLLVLRAPAARSEGRVIPHPGVVSAVIAASSHIPPGMTVVTTERQVLFMTTWYTGAPATLRPDRVPYGQRLRLLTLAFIGMGSPLEAAIDAARADERVSDPPRGVDPRHRNGLVLVTEPTWEWLLGRLPDEVRAHWSRWPTI